MENWRQKQKESFRSLDSLLSFLSFDEQNRKQILNNPKFPILVPKRIAEKMRKNDPSCPLFRQFVPLSLETRDTPGFSTDPLCESTFQKEEKLLHKYQGRALIVTTGACAMHCRYCFRQNFSYQKNLFEKELTYLKETNSIEEVILSGGDPLSLNDETLHFLLSAIEKIPHIKLIRFHTRFPIGIPERLSSNFIQMASKIQKQIIFVLHINHPLELDSTVLSFIKQLPFPILSQAVLLSGVNDDAATLKELFLLEVTHGILPYYLHQCDKISGGAHFMVSKEQGLSLMNELTKSLPGYAVPKYVEEIPGKTSKSSIIMNCS